MTNHSPYNLASSNEFATELLSRMTLAEKAGQITQIEKNSITPEDVAEYGIGSVLSGGGGNPEPNNPQNWLAMVSSFVDASRNSRLGIPALYGTDAVHGHSNMVGATIFPHQIGLGASADPNLVERVYRAAALETIATGARWMFAPALSVALDERWGRTYESFSDDPELVSILGEAAVRGMIGDRPDGPDAALTSIKHFVGDGGTQWGSAKPVEWLDFWDGWGGGWQLDQGDTQIDEVTLRDTHMMPFRASIASGALTVMASYNSWNGAKLHGHRYLLTDVLKGELGFDGFVISDWLGIGQLDPDPHQCIVKGLSAGIDMVMVPFDYKEFIASVVKGVESGDVDEQRLDDAVLRILRVKHAIGLFDAVEPAPGLDVVGCPAHRQLAREAAAASAVLLRDDRSVLPVSAQPIVVAGSGANDIGTQCGGWTIEWQGGAGPTTSGTTILEALTSRGFDVVDTSVSPTSDGAQWPTGIVVVAEQPYAEGNGDSADCALPADDLAAIQHVRPLVENLVLVVLSGRPVVLDTVQDQCDAIVAAWLPGSEGDGVADVLTGERPFTGTLPRPWFDSWPRGHGLGTT